MLVLKGYIRGMLEPDEREMLLGALEELSSSTLDSRQRFRLIQVERVLCERPEHECPE